jgi:curved DNA-binding protein CbpA
MQPVTDPYRALGVPRGATEADIKAAHRRLAKRYHPDATGGDSNRFLKVQEAYRVLSDPLLRREWDAAHAGPVRADRAAAPRPRRARTARHQPDAAPDSRADPGPASGGDGDPDRDTAGRGDAQEEAARRTASGRPRSARAYTWTATEVPWWEEGTARQGRRRAKRSDAADESGQQEPSPRPSEPVGDFDVYNRSSGAAWSQAARKYFRRGDQDLPSRGSFRHQGTQPLTAARARAAAEAEARQRATSRPPRSPARGTTPPEPGAARGTPRPGPPPAGPGAPAYAYASAGVARDPERVAHVREEYMRRTRALQWPSLRQRLLYALLAWLPLALLVGYGYTQYTGCGPLLLECSQSAEPALLVTVGVLLLLLVILPKVAYVAAMGTIAMVAAALVATGILAYMRAPLPPATAALIVLAVVMAIAYTVTVLVVTVRGGPWRGATPR